MKIFLDDKRPAPDDKYRYSSFQDYKSCILMIGLCRSDLEIISLDYDLGEEHTGLDVLIYMKENGITPRQINIHSDHMIGSREMADYARKNFPETKITRQQWQ